MLTLRVTSGAGFALLVAILLGHIGRAAFAQSAETADADEGAATQTLEASGSLDAAGDAVALDTEALQAVAKSIVTVTLKSAPAGPQPTSLVGVIVPAMDGQATAGWVVVPYPYTWITEEGRWEMRSKSEFRLDDEKWQTWEGSGAMWKSQFDGATVQGDDWSGTASFVSVQSYLDLVLLQLDEAHRNRPVLTLNMEPKHEQQEVVVHDATTRKPGRLAIARDYINPWQVEMPDGSEAVAGSVVTNLEGQLLGIVGRFELNKESPLAERGGRDFIHCLIPARYAKTIVDLQQPTVQDHVANLLIGTAMGRENEQVEQAKAFVDNRVPMRSLAGRAGFESSGMAGRGGAMGRSSDADEAARRPGGSRFGGGIAASDDRTDEFMKSGRGGMGGRGMRGFGPQTEPREMKVFALKHLSPEDAIGVLSSLFGGSTAFSAVPGQNTIIANGPAGQFQQIEALLQTLDALPSTEEKQTGPVTLLHAPQTVSPDGALFAGGAEPRAVEMKWFRLEHIHPVSANNALLPLFPGGGPMASIPPVMFIAVQSQRALIVRGLVEDLKKIEALLKVLDVPDEATAGAAATRPESQETATEDLGPQPIVDHTPIVEGFASDDLPAAIQALRTEFEEHTAYARQCAEDTRGNWTGGKAAFLTQRLHSAVVQAFDSRQKLQQAELAALKQRVDSMRRTIEARLKIKDAIIERRVEELLNPALEWDTSANGKQSPANDANASTVKSDSPVSFAATTTDASAATSTDVAAANGGPIAGTSGFGPGLITSPYETQERVYSGKSEFAWQEAFAAETDPVAKFEAATALLNLAAQLSPDQHVERILDVGEEIVRSAYGDAALDFAFATVPPSDARRWNLQSGKNHAAYSEFYGELIQRSRGIPGDALIRGLSGALRQGSDARAAFAYSLLSNPWEQFLKNVSQQERNTLFDSLQTPETGLDRSALCLLARAQFAGSADQEQLAELTVQTEALVRLLLSTPADQSSFGTAITRKLFGSHNLIVDNQYVPGPIMRVLSGPPVARALAELLLREVSDGRAGNVTLVQWPLVVNESMTPYDQVTVGFQRTTNGVTLPAWESVANDYFAQRRQPPYTSTDRLVLNGLFRATSLYSDGDDWPVARSAEILTQQLRSVYTDDPAQTVDQPVSDLLPATPLMMLSQIVAITGQIPDFVKSEAPKSSRLTAQLTRLDQNLATARSRGMVEIGPGGLLDEVPYQIVSRCVDESFPEGASFEFRELKWSEAAEPTSLLNATSRMRAQPRNRTVSPIDPLLLLAIVNELTGRNETQDRHIASLLLPMNPPYDIRPHIESLLASQLQSRHHAARFLREMSEKSKSTELSKWIESIDTPLAEISASPATTSEPEK